AALPVRKGILQCEQVAEHDPVAVKPTPAAHAFDGVLPFWIRGEPGKGRGAEGEGPALRYIGGMRRKELHPRRSLLRTERVQKIRIGYNDPFAAPNDELDTLVQRRDEFRAETLVRQSLYQIAGHRGRQAPSGGEARQCGQLGVRRFDAVARPRQLRLRRLRHGKRVFGQRNQERQQQADPAAHRHRVFVPPENRTQGKVDASGVQRGPAAHAIDRATVVRALAGFAFCRFWACCRGSMSNRLASATSPYLQQHAENPVDWMEWGEDAFERAKREEKPIFLSIGYSTCH